LNRQFGIERGILGSIGHAISSTLTAYEDYLNQPIDHSEPGAPVKYVEPPPAQVTYTVDPADIPTDRINRVSDRINALTQAVDKLIQNPPSSDRIGKLKADIAAKRDELSKEPKIIHFEYATVPEAQTQFKLLNLVPKDGSVIEPHLIRRFASIITHTSPEVITADEIWYPGVEGNLTLGSDESLSVGRLIFYNSVGKSCAVKTVAVHFFNANSQPLGISTGNLRLGNTSEREELELPTFVETSYVRIVVTENWGDSERTCLRAIRVVHA
jgi:hypothetical protein